MGFFQKLFGRPEKKNALIVLEESNSELRKLLFLEKQHSANLLQQLSKALGDTKESVSETPAKEPSKGPVFATPREQDVLDLLKENEKITSAFVCKALNYSCRQIASARLSKMVKKGLIKTVGTGKLTAYVLPGDTSSKMPV